MIVIDKLLVGGLKFVLDKIARAVDQELYDPERLREELLAAQMRLELGEISEAEFHRIERSVLDRLNELRHESVEQPSSGKTRVKVDAISSYEDE